MNGDDNVGNGKSVTTGSFLYRTLVVGLSGWVLVAVLKGNDRSIAMEAEIKHFNAAVLRVESNMQTLVTKTELELSEKRLQNEQLKFQNEFLKITQPQALMPPMNKHTGK